MAKKDQTKTAEPKAEETTKTPEPEKGSEKSETRKRWLIPILQEAFQDALLLLLFAIGIKRPMGGMINGTAQQQTAQAPEKQVPDWILSAFPSLTDEDEVEYNLCLSSNPDPLSVHAAEIFEENLKNEGIYDEVKYRIRLLKIRREFLEKLRHPAPKDESGGRLGFKPLTLADPVIEFMDRLRDEVDAGGTTEEIFERQKEIANRRKLLEKISFTKKTILWIRNHKLETVVGIFLVPIGIIELIFLFLG